jgi:hypothetical protein
MCQLLPLEFANKRAKYIRHRLYAIAAKVIKTGRKVIIKCQAQYYQLLTKAKVSVKTMAEFSGKKIFLIKFPIGILWILARIKPQMIASLYGAFVFDSTTTQKTKK